MNSGPLISLGVMLTIAAAWLGLAFAPHSQVSDYQPVAPLQGEGAYPRPTSGLAERGREVYIANGCIQCHSQHVRPGVDQQRGLGTRPSVPQDYQFDRPALLGVNRLGPDLANVGARRPDANWHYRHLFYPQAVSQGSNMPSFRHLFEYRKLGLKQPSNNKIKTKDSAGKLVEWNFDGVPDNLKPQKDYEVVLTDEAEALVAYLLSLDHSQPLTAVDAK